MVFMQLVKAQMSRWSLIKVLAVMLRNSRNKETVAHKFTHLKELIVVFLHFHITDGTYKNINTRGVGVN